MRRATNFSYAWKQFLDSWIKGILDWGSEPNKWSDIVKSIIIHGIKISVSSNNEGTSEASGYFIYNLKILTDEGDY